MSLPRILFITDQPDGAEALARSIRELGIEFDFRWSTAAALAPAIAAADPDLVVVAQASPDAAIRGLATFAVADPPLPFVVVAESVGGDMDGRWRELGAWDCIRPSEQNQLVARIRPALAIGQMRRRVSTLEAEATERFRTLAELAPVLVWEWDGDGRVGFGNRLWEKAHGKACRDAGDWTSLIHPEDRAGFQLGFAQCRAAETIYDGCLRMQRSDGEVRSVLVRAMSWSTGSGQGPTGIACGADRADKPPAATPTGLPAATRHELNNQFAVIRMIAEVFALTPGMPASCLPKAQELVAATERATQLLRRATRPAEPR